MRELEDVAVGAVDGAAHVEHDEVVGAAVLGEPVDRHQRIELARLRAQRQRQQQRQGGDGGDSLHGFSARGAGVNV
ncbi:MAG: hypothetical protein U5K43_07550 [Halofilum sp. (in: g-proteobacteria)]|nr:hypothetical protein [Halofilum sp. (in: g-proteobacteria)]